MQTMVRIFVATWQVLVLMAPYLLLGFAIAGMISALLSPAWVRRHMGGRGLWQVVKAALIGVPMPLCSCGVLPVALSLRRHGAGRGAVASFLASTPQTGVDSILATYGLLGPVVSIFRVAAALVSGLLAGGLVTAAYPREDAAAAEEEASAGDRAAQPAAWKRMLRHGFVTLPRDVARPLLLGVLVSGILSALVPVGALEGYLHPGWGAYGLALLVGIPMYVCSTASIPMAASLVHMGASPGAAMVFLIAGPATNAAMLAAMWSRLGRLGTCLYLAAIVVTALAAGWILDVSFPAALAAVPALTERCAACAADWWGIIAAVVLLALLVPGLPPEKEEEAG
jgi:uncharacterized membrane protein YraQ (UPF0718 family)